MSSTIGDCTICGAITSPGVTEWTRFCRLCGLWQSSLKPDIDSLGHVLSEQARADGLVHLRLSNFKITLDRMALFMELKGSRLLDVGCAYGWFMEAAQERGVTVLGVEPDKETGAMARCRGLEVIEGYFPQCLDTDEFFDTVVFNDVFEHVSDIHGNLAACNAKLRPSGLLVLNVPTSMGTLFRLAKNLAKLGWSLPWNRLWQKDFPSPHLYYFNPDNIDRLLQRHGFHKVDHQGTDTFDPKGLWSRLRFSKRSNILLSGLLYIGLVLSYPFYRLTGKPDTVLLIYRKGLSPEL